MPKKEKSPQELVMEAIKNQKPENLEKILSKDLNPEELANDYFAHDKPMQEAIKKGNIEVVKILLKYGAKLEVGDFVKNRSGKDKFRDMVHKNLRPFFEDYLGAQHELRDSLTQGEIPDDSFFTTISEKFGMEKEQFLNSTINIDEDKLLYAFVIEKNYKIISYLLKNRDDETEISSYVSNRRYGYDIDCIKKLLEAVIDKASPEFVRKLENIAFEEIRSRSGIIIKDDNCYKPYNHDKITYISPKDDSPDSIISSLKDVLLEQEKGEQPNKGPEYIQLKDVETLEKKWDDFKEYAASKRVELLETNMNAMPKEISNIMASYLVGDKNPAPSTSPSSASSSLSLDGVKEEKGRE